MFAHDWPEEIDPPGDELLPLHERAWFKRLMEQKAARERFNREHPHWMEDAGRAVGQQMQEMALKIVMGEEE